MLAFWTERMGHAEADFWELTYRELAVRIRHFKQRVDREDYRAGIVAAAVLNSVRSKEDQKVWKPEDWFPGLVKAEQPRRTALEISTNFRIAHAIWHRQHGKEQYGLGKP